MVHGARGYAVVVTRPNIVEDARKEEATMNRISPRLVEAKLSACSAATCEERKCWWQVCC